MRDSVALTLRMGFDRCIRCLKHRQSYPTLYVLQPQDCLHDNTYGHETERLNGLWKSLRSEHMTGLKNYHWRTGMNRMVEQIGASHTEQGGRLACCMVAPFAAVGAEVAGCCVAPNMHSALEKKQAA